MIKLIALVALASCVSKREVDAKIWLNNFPVPKESCDAAPAIKEYGFYRRLNDGNFEFVSICNKASRGFKQMSNKDFARLMNRINEPDDNQKAVEILDPRESGAPTKSTRASEAQW